jgi:valyl-tRNA synthetase
LIEVEDSFGKYRLSDAINTVRGLIWDDFCSWYLEMIKPEFGEQIDRATYDRSIDMFETLLKILHPFMPFITEELWHNLRERKPMECIIVADYPRTGKFDSRILEEAALSFEVIGEVRNTRNAKGISPKDALTLEVRNGQQAPIQTFWPVIKKLGNLSEINFVSEIGKTDGSAFVIRGTEFYIPLGAHIDVEKERETIRKDLDYQRGFLNMVEKKLSNEKFVSGAPPHVIEVERKKKADAEAKIRSLEENLGRLG